MKHAKLTKKEKEVLDGILRGEYSRVEDYEEHMAMLKKAAKNTLRKNKNINIRINEGDLLSIKQKAIQKGLPYQTLISSILHQYATEQIKVDVT
ncbi:hypothetical protein GF389_06050 [Candidatus Dojkabacteria bacterium]|nr:hypothetical protein [Candidatus Dojkabacteria bacterium]